MAMTLRDPASLPRGQQERRQRILSAANTLLEDGDYDAIQMRDIAGQAEVALATIYRYFTSKEHLYAAALLEWAADFRGRGRPSAPGAEADEARLRRLMRRAVRSFERSPQMVRVITVLESSKDPNARACFDEFAALNAGALTDALSATDADTASAIIDAANSVMFTRLRSWSQGRTSIQDVQRHVERTLDLIFSPAPTAAA
jgi:TetR/AcrR family transcriptional regulator, cholesterol catabolism regulator